MKQWMHRLFAKVRYAVYCLSPELAIKLEFKRNAGYWPDLKNPKTFNEKLTWMKLYGDFDVLGRCVDKYTVREYIKEKGLEKLLVNLYGVYDNPDDIDFEKLPEKFVLKVVHGCGYNILCKDKSALDIEKTRRQLKQWQKESYFKKSLEKQYKNVKPRIICEEFIETQDGKPPSDYKIFCFNGEPSLIYFVTDRCVNDAKVDFYDKDWNDTPIVQKNPKSGIKRPRPKQLDEMYEYARKLSEDFPVVRVDFYNENGKIYFGELTFTHYSGNVRFKTAEWDRKLGDMIDMTGMEKRE